MPVPIANRATIAGLGSTAALLAAVMAVSLVVGGLVAYSGSPSGPLVTREPRLALPGSTAETAIAVRRTPKPLVLPGGSAAAAGGTAAPARTAGGLLGPAAGGRRQGGVPTSRSERPKTPNGADQRPVTGSVGAIAPPATSAGAGILPNVPGVAPPTSALADAAAATGQALGGTLRDTLGVVGAAVARVSPPLGQTVDGLGVGLGGTVSSTTDGLAAVLRHLGG